MWGGSGHPGSQRSVSAGKHFASPETLRYPQVRGRCSRSAQACALEPCLWARIHPPSKPPFRGFSVNSAGTVGSWRLSYPQMRLESDVCTSAQTPSSTNVVAQRPALCVTVTRGGVAGQTRDTCVQAQWVP